MFDTCSRQRAIAPFLAVLIALGLWGCSSDTRAILAPTDAQLSLTAAGPLIANQPVDVTIVASKSDGNPVADGTEIQLKASAGTFEPAKVRTQGGQAASTYWAEGPGAVELTAASDVVQGALVLVAASAAPARVTISVSTDTLPPSGGELDVTATVFGSSDERVSNAPVQFVATSGSFAPVGPLLTNDQGQVSTRLSTTNPTEVRARVHALESSPVQIALKEPLGKGDQEELPFRMRDVVWLNENVGEWDVTSTVTDVRIDRDTICIEHTKAGRWPRRNGGEGNPWVVANVGGTWYAATYEYLRSGQICKHIERRGEWGIGPHTKRPPLETWAPRRGELVGFFVSTFARDSTRTSNERSNIMMVEWPY
jgi:hypothetical protein